jgi:hypothetical protein
VTAITFFVDSDRQLDQSNDEKNAERECAPTLLPDLIFGPDPCYKQKEIRTAVGASAPSGGDGSNEEDRP